MTRKTRDIQSALLKKGFREDSTKHHIYFWFFNEGKKTTINTYFSHNASDIPSPLISQMAKQTKLDKAGFLELVDCGMDEGAYRKLLADGDHLPRDPQQKDGAKKPS